MSIQAIVFDLGDVLMSWQSPVEGRVDAKTLKRAMTSQTWHDFDRGQISEDECFGRIGRAMNISPVDLRDTVEKAKLSLRPNSSMVDTLKHLRVQHCHVKIYLASNISQPHWNHVRQVSNIDWNLFDGLFISAEIGMRKPDICFYQYILDRLNLKHNPSSVIFFDDKLENVVTARALGLTAMRFEDAETTHRQLTNMLADPISRGKSYLEVHAGRMWSFVNEIEIKENFAQLLILEASDGRQDLVTLKPSTLLWNYFQERPAVSTLQFPDDFDTTSIALTVLERTVEDNDKINEVLDLIMEYRNCDGLPMVYADHSRPRFDPVVCVHIFTLFHLNGRSWQLKETWAHIIKILENRAYKNGTYYYTVPDYFLFSLSRLIEYCRERALPLPGSQEDATLFLDLFRSRCLERVNASPDDALSLAIRAIACRRADISPEILSLDIEKLRLLQESDGGWPGCEIYKVPSAKAGVGNRGVVTALAIKALKMTRVKATTITTPPKTRLNVATVGRRLATDLVGRVESLVLMLASPAEFAAEFALYTLRFDFRMNLNEHLGTGVPYGIFERAFSRKKVSQMQEEIWS